MFFCFPLYNFLFAYFFMYSLSFILFNWLHFLCFSYTSPFQMVFFICYYIIHVAFQGTFVYLIIYFLLLLESEGRSARLLDPLHRKIKKHVINHRKTSRRHTTLKHKLQKMLFERLNITGLNTISVSQSLKFKFNTFPVSYLNTQGLNNSCLKSPASTLVDLTFQSRALRSFSLNQLRNLSL